MVSQAQLEQAIRAKVEGVTSLVRVAGPLGPRAGPRPRAAAMASKADLDDDTGRV
jgi:hypothetical protein